MTTEGLKYAFYPVEDDFVSTEGVLGSEAACKRLQFGIHWRHKWWTQKQNMGQWLGMGCLLGLMCAGPQAAGGQGVAPPQAPLAHLPHKPNGPPCPTQQFDCQLLLGCSCAEGRSGCLHEWLSAGAPVVWLCHCTGQCSGAAAAWATGWWCSDSPLSTQGP